MSTDILQGTRVAFIGRLAGMTHREAVQLVRRHGGILLDKPAASAHLVVVGEEGLPLPETGADEDWFDESSRAALELGTLEVISETEWWRRLGMVEPHHDLPRLYTPAMLAELLGVKVEVIRRWHRRGLIQPARQVRRLPYFDFQEVATAKRLAELLAAGVKPGEIEKKLAELARLLPDVKRPLAQLSVIVEGKAILLRQGDGLVEAGGQLRFDFEAAHLGPKPAVQSPAAETAPPPSVETPAAAANLHLAPEELCRMAAEMEEEGQLASAADMYRAALAAGGPEAETCFQLAELLYRQGDLSAARERYYMAIELDEDYVEARANLGCVLAEQGRAELAIAAFEGALRYHGGYADVYYHLARTLDDLGRREEAAGHWRTFMALSPGSPWAEEARQRLEEKGLGIGD